MSPALPRIGDTRRKDSPPPDLIWKRQSQELGQFSTRLYEPGDEPKYRIYVIRLNDEVLNVKRFREANPNKPGKPCYYVGMTSRTVEERFSQHRAGHWDCSFVRDYGLYPGWKKFQALPLLSQGNAKLKEVEHADYLRSQAYAVWQR